MTVYVHRDNERVGYGEHFHTRPSGTETRTWSFDCTPACEERIIRDVEHTGRNEASVPLTVEELAEEEQLEVTSKKDVARLARTLGHIAREDVAANA